MRTPVEQGCYDGSTIMDADGHLIATAKSINDAREIVNVLNKYQKLIDFLMFEISTAPTNEPPHLYEDNYDDYAQSECDRVAFHFAARVRHILANNERGGA